MDEFSQRRARMVQQQIARRGVSDPEVLRAMRETPRHLFVPELYRDHAYDDMPLPIAAGQTISQPFIVAAMIELAEVEPGDRVLEIGAGSGYAAAVMSRIAARVEAIERHQELAEAARAQLRDLGYDNVEIHLGDGSGGLPDRAPFDAIIASAAAPEVPEALKRQLDVGGVLVMPVGRAPQRLIKVRRSSEDDYEEEYVTDVAFVPLIGEHGWASAAACDRDGGPL